MSESCGSEEKRMKILFVCYGNTCRSLMAEAVFKDLIKKQNVDSNFFVDSAGISGWQSGDNPNYYVRSILERCHIPFSHKARQICIKDYKSFDYLVGMDEFNIMELNRGVDALQTKNKVVLLGTFNSNNDEKIIHDPFFDNRQEDFEKCNEQISSSCSNFLKELLEEM